ncbi:hypothetical protein GCM10022222_38810 [Amycolatopsis ultiminotia]|uniref:D-3-phosphoglycerate dehydrogenase n=1 Tax=Amycolatopsis ultiminotia TaxID=543629 RepID=A0ABP6WI08_9PSEU
MVVPKVGVDDTRSAVTTSGPRPRVVVVSRSAEMLVDGLAPALASGITVSGARTLPRGRGIHGLVVAPPVRMTEEDLRQVPDLRVLVAAAIGDDHLPVRAADRRGVPVTTIAGYCTVEVADHTIAMAASLLRAIPAGERQVRSGRWDTSALGARRITGSRLGIVGLGGTGRLVLGRARGLGMTVAVHAPRTPRETIVALGGEPRESLPDLLAEVDVLTLHVPLTERTRGLIGAGELRRMKRGSYLVNTSRGELVDLAALRAALQDGHLAGAALDVFDEEPVPAGHPAFDLPNTVLTPHMAWLSPEATPAGVGMIADALNLALG